MEELIRQTAQQMAEGYANAEIPMYGASLRLPERAAVLDILGDFQKLLFPAYFGDKHLVKLPPEQYSALVLHHVMEKLERQIALALPEAEEARAKEICCGLVEKLPKIQDLLRQVDMLAVPSHTETFGLVYAEAMSQGLPVIYTRGQGFDGQFPEGTVGYSVDSHDAEEMAEKIVKVCERYDELSQDCADAVQRFRWDGIAREYRRIYEAIGEEQL